MSKIKRQPEVIVNIERKPPTPVQKAMAKKFWAKLVSECKREVSQ